MYRIDENGESRWHARIEDAEKDAIETAERRKCDVYVRIGSSLAWRSAALYYHESGHASIQCIY